jgi:hypothetical protein
MKTLTQVHRSRRAIAVIVAAITVGGVSAYGASATGSGVVYACKNDTNGVVRIVDPDAVCRVGESAVSWNEAGPPGLPGADGAPGADGRDGVDGAPGVDGKDGSTWHNGTGAASADLGRDGDLYLDASTGDVYRKVGGTWQLTANIKGPKGDAAPMTSIPVGDVYQSTTVKAGQLNAGTNTIASLTVPVQGTYLFHASTSLERVGLSPNDWRADCRVRDITLGVTVDNVGFHYHGWTDTANELHLAATVENVVAEGVMGVKANDQLRFECFLPSDEFSTYSSGPQFYAIRVGPKL